MISLPNVDAPSFPTPAPLPSNLVMTGGAYDIFIESKISDFCIALIFAEVSFVIEALAWLQSSPICKNPTKFIPTPSPVSHCIIPAFLSSHFNSPSIPAFLSSCPFMTIQAVVLKIIFLS